MKKKDYKITFSLQEGYHPGAKVHPVKNAEQIIKKWLEERIGNREQVITGPLQQGTIFFRQTRR